MTDPHALIAAARELSDLLRQYSHDLGNGGTDATALRNDLADAASVVTDLCSALEVALAERDELRVRLAQWGRDYSRAKDAASSYPQGFKDDGF